MEDQKQDFADEEEIVINEDSDFEEFKESIEELITTIKDTNESKQDEKNLDDLIDYLEQKDVENEETKAESEKNIDEIKELLKDEELTEEEKEQLEQQLEQEENIKDLSEQYYHYMINDNADNQHLIIDNLVGISEQLDTIIEQNNTPSTSDHVANIYGLVVLPAVIIIVVFWKMIKPFLP